MNIAAAVVNGDTTGSDERLTAAQIGAHLVIDAWTAEPEILQDPQAMARLVDEIATSCSATVMQFHSHRFEPTGGITAIAILSTSHLAIHTWPEYSYLTVDLLVCNPELVDVPAVEEHVRRSVDTVSSIASITNRALSITDRPLSTPMT